ncbi:hypothetical protein H5410_012897 [Solanum commersonii]|uniref:Uncharacterized protein n=1 Tax=Solanum commersonii TaxID=4109 RepID=A0A9J6AU48_SOLCO|nr:hypothetical protein H5410_012897 [Solanum commersonii]
MLFFWCKEDGIEEVEQLVDFLGSINSPWVMRCTHKQLGACSDVLDMRGKASADFAPTFRA